MSSFVMMSFTFSMMAPQAFQISSLEYTLTPFSIFTPETDQKMEIIEVSNLR
jgi:hypothetical protein